MPDLYPFVQSPAMPTQGPQQRDDQVLAGPAPCDDCRHAVRCRVKLEACGAFGIYVAGLSELRWRTAPRFPTHDRWQAIFEPGVNSARPVKRPRQPITAEERRRRDQVRQQLRRARVRERGAGVAQVHR